MLGILFATTTHHSDRTNYFPPECQTERDTYFFTETDGSLDFVPNSLTPGTCMVTMTTPSRHGFALKAFENHRKYAHQHGHAHFSYELPQHRSHPEEWYKIQALQKYIEHPLCSQWLLWIDDDIIITNPSNPLSSFIDAYGQENLVQKAYQFLSAHLSTSKFLDHLLASTHIIIAKDAHHDRGVPINNGIFLLKNSRWSKKFLERVWEEGKIRGYLTRGRSLLEQQTMTDLMAENPSDERRIKVIPQRDMNSFLRDQEVYHDNVATSGWHPGDFAAHVTGMPINLRAAIIKTLLQDTKRVPDIVSIKTSLARPAIPLISNHESSEEETLDKGSFLSLLYTIRNHIGKIISHFPR